MLLTKRPSGPASCLVGVSVGVCVVRLCAHAKMLTRGRQTCSEEPPLFVWFFVLQLQLLHQVRVGSTNDPSLLIVDWIASVYGVRSIGRHINAALSGGTATSPYI